MPLSRIVALWTVQKRTHKPILNLMNIGGDPARFLDGLRAGTRSEAGGEQKIGTSGKRGKVIF